MQWVDSGFGHRFTGARTGLAYFSDNMSVISRQYDFNARGIWRPRGTISAESFYGALERFWNEAYPQLVYQTEDRTGYRHTPAQLGNTANFTRYINEYVKIVANLYSIGSAFSLDGWNRGVLPISDALRAIGAHRGRILSMLDTMSNIPMYPFFRDLAVYLGRLTYDRAYGLVLLKVFTWDQEWSQTPRNAAPAFDPIGAVAEAATFNWTSGAASGHISALLTDCETSISVIMGRAGAAAADLADMIAIRQLMEILEIPRGLPEIPGLVQDAGYVDRFLYRQFFGCEDTHGVGGNEYNGAPYLNAPDAGQAEVNLIVRGKGNPDPYLYTGMAGILGVNLPAATGTVGVLYNRGVGADLDATIYGALRRSEGGTGNTTNGDTNPGLNEVSRYFTLEDGWEMASLRSDMGDGATLNTVITSLPFLAPHQHALHVLACGQIAEEHRFMLDVVDYEWIQPLSTFPDILRRQMGSALGLAAI
jgi:hypothetical protein